MKKCMEVHNCHTFSQAKFKAQNLSLYVISKRHAHALQHLPEQLNPSPVKGSLHAYVQSKFELCCPSLVQSALTSHMLCTHGSGTKGLWGNLAVTV